MSSKLSGTGISVMALNGSLDEKRVQALLNKYMSGKFEAITPEIFNSN